MRLRIADTGGIRDRDVNRVQFVYWPACWLWSRLGRRRPHPPAGTGVMSPDGLMEKGPDDRIAVTIPMGRRLALTA